MNEVFEAIGIFATVAVAIGCAGALIWYFCTTISHVAEIRELRRRSYEETSAREDLDRRVGNVERRVDSVDEVLTRVEGTLAEEPEVDAKRLLDLDGRISEQERQVKSTAAKVQLLLDEAEERMKTKAEEPSPAFGKPLRG